MGQVSHTAPLDGPWEATGSVSTFFSLPRNGKVRIQHVAQAVKTLAWIDLVKSDLSRYPLTTEAHPDCSFEGLLERLL